MRTATKKLRTSNRVKAEIKIIEHNSKEYKSCVKIRNEVLRFPLGMKLDPKKLKLENQDIHLAAWVNNKLIGCLILTPETIGEIKMRQVAVTEKYRNNGIGFQMVQFAEEWAANKGYRKVYCHARDIAAHFYEKMNYYQLGEPFEEIGIKHFRLEKTL